jgi:hypothetical protein
MSPTSDPRVPALGDGALAWAGRGVWVACIAVYLTVFVGGIAAGASDLSALGKAMGFTLATALLGRVAVGFLARASVPVQQVPSADEDGTVGSLVDLVASPNLARPEDEAGAA